MNFYSFAEKYQDIDNKHQEKYILPEEWSNKNKNISTSSYQTQWKNPFNM